MKKHEFLRELEQLLPRESAENTISYFSEMIDDMMEDGIPEEAAVAQLGEPQKIVAGLIEETGEAAADIKQRRRIRKVDYAAKGDIVSLHIHTVNREIALTQSPDDRVHLRYEEWETEYHTITEQNGTLKLEPPKKRYEPIFRPYPQPNPKLEIALPETAYETIHLQTTNGAIRSPIAVTAKQFGVQSTNGVIRLEQLTTGQLDAKSANGAIRCFHLKAEEVTLTTSNGAIRLADSTVDYLKATNANGRIRLDQSEIKEPIRLITSNAGVFLNDCSLPKGGKIVNSNGPIQLTLKGRREDYRIGAHTINGKTQVGENTTGKISLQLTTCNAGISAQFA